MTKGIEIKKSGFNVPIGTINVFFSTSVENLSRLKDSVAKLEAQEEELVNEFLSVDTDKLNSDNADESNKELDKGLKAYEDIVRLNYDGILGEGTYDQLLSEYDLWSLEDAYPRVVGYIEKEVEKFFESRTANKNKVLDDFHKKQAKKRKK